VLRHERVDVARQPLELRAVCGTPGVSDRDGHVAQQAAPLRALHGAAAEALAERFVVELAELGEVGA
jgi:hypothetical protein